MQALLKIGLKIGRKGSVQRVGACSAPQVVQLPLKLHKIQDPAGTRAQIQQKPPQNPNRQDCGFEEHGQTRERDGLQGQVQSQLKKYLNIVFSFCVLWNIGLFQKQNIQICMVILARQMTS